MFYRKSIIILILSIFTFSCEKAKENIELPGKLLFEQDGYFFETKVKKLESDEFTPIFKFDESQIRYVRWSPDFSKILFLVNEYSADNQYKTNILKVT